MLRIGVSADRARHRDQDHPGEVSAAGMVAGRHGLDLTDASHPPSPQASG
jgi:hypothetical protein